MSQETEILTVQELHLYLKIPKPTLYALAQNGRLPALKIGKHWRFRRSEVDHWLTSHRWDPAAHPRRRRESGNNHDQQ